MTAKANGATADDLMWPSYAACGLVVALWTSSLRVLGFGRSVSLLRGLTSRKPRRPPPSLAIPEQVSHRIAAASVLLPARILCLEQSFALYYCLRCLGFEARLR